MTWTPIARQDRRTMLWGEYEPGALARAHREYDGGYVELATRKIAAGYELVSMRRKLRATRRLGPWFGRLDTQGRRF